MALNGFRAGTATANNTIYSNTTSPSWDTVKIGPGGNVLGASFANDGTAVCRTDTGESYIKVGSADWRLLYDMNTMPAGRASIMGNYDASDGVNFDGCYCVELAPNDATRVYMIDTTGRFYRSSDQGLTFSTSNWPQASVGVNGAHDSGFDHGIAVDPSNKDTVWACSPANGVRKSSDGGATFGSANVTLGTNATYKPLVAFASSSVLFCAIYGGAQAGVWKSTDSGANWSAMNGAGMPTTFKNMTVTGSGTLIVVDDSGVVKRLSGSTWTTPAVKHMFWGGSSPQSVAADPNNANRVLMIGGEGSVSESTDDGVTWTAQTDTPNIRSAPVIPWIATTEHGNFALSQCAFNPAQTNELWIADGITVWKCNPPQMTSVSSVTIVNTGTINFTTQAGAPISIGDPFFLNSTANVTNSIRAVVTAYNSGTGAVTATAIAQSGSGTFSSWYMRNAVHCTDVGAGIEQMINNRVVFPPSGKLNVFNWDRIQFYSNDNSVYPSNQAYVATPGKEILHGWDGDYAQSDPTFLAMVADNPFTADKSGYSTNGGLTWTEFTNKPSGVGTTFSRGAICAFTDQKLVFAPGEGFSAGANRPQFTTNRGGSAWSFCTFPAAVPTTGSTGWGTSLSDNGKLLCVDRGINGALIGYALNLSTLKFYKTTDAGANYSLTNASVVPMNGGALSAVSYIKGMPANGGSADTTGWVVCWGVAIASDCFIRTKNGGTSWSTVDTTFTTVSAVGFGKSVNGVAPAVLVVAKKSGVRGVYLSTDDMATWKNVTGTFKSADQIKDITGDPDNAGVWYITTYSSGTIKGTNIA